MRGELLQPWDTVPPRHDCVNQSWDTASKCGELNDYYVCTTWAIQNHRYHLLDVFPRKLQYLELRRAVIDQQKRWNARAIPVEDKSSGTALVQDFRNGGLGQGGRPIAIEPEGDKITRAATQSVAIEAGRVFIPRRADWPNNLRMAIIQFPNGRHDDQVDSISQFLKWAERPSQGVIKKRKSGF
jgi:predicted phage terminase large subunit-like protein